MKANKFKGEFLMELEYQPQDIVNRPQLKVRVIPAIVDRSTDKKVRPKKRVCAYCRISNGEEEQQSSYNLQVEHYTDFIENNDLWEFCGIYADKGISGTSIKHRTNFKRMIEDCMAGKIDMIITKSISRFARNTLDCLNYVRMLKALPSPVAIYFEKENIDTLDEKSELLLTLLSSLAQDESRSISENIRWGKRKRFKQGVVGNLLTKFFIGYDIDKQGNLVINEEQAETVRRVYRDFLEGKGVTKIAKELTSEGIKTREGTTTWTSNNVYQILSNEKYCGDVLLQKTVSVDFLNHKTIQNTGQQPQYLVVDHHPAIISKEEWNAVQKKRKRHFNMNNINVIRQSIS